MWLNQNSSIRLTQVFLDSASSRIIPVSSCKHTEAVAYDSSSYSYTHQMNKWRQKMVFKTCPKDVFYLSGFKKLEHMIWCPQAVFFTWVAFTCSPSFTSNMLSLNSDDVVQRLLCPTIPFDRWSDSPHFTLHHNSLPNLLHGVYAVK